jgi:hypothetical protein
MKKIFAALIVSASAFGMGCSVEAIDTEATQEPAMTAEEETGSAAEALSMCPAVWVCYGGPNSGKEYSNSGSCMLFCGAGNRCGIDRHCSPGCYCP